MALEWGVLETLAAVLTLQHRKTVLIRETNTRYGTSAVTILSISIIYASIRIIEEERRMADLAARLHEFWHNPHTRRLARSAPLSLLAGCAGVTLGTLIALPGFATTGLGVVLGGLAINLTSNLISKLTDPDLDDLEREASLEQALAQGDLDAQALTAALLTREGSTIAQALPEASRNDLTSALGQAMQQAGGPLARIAPRYAAALRDPMTDWNRLQVALSTDIQQTYLEMKAKNIRESPMRVEGREGDVTMLMDAEQDIVGSSMTVIGKQEYGTSEAFAPPTSDRTTVMRQQLANLEANLHRIEVRISETVLPSEAPLQLQRDKEHLQAQIAEVKRQLGEPI
jgi:hypothetical protein